MAGPFDPFTPGPAADPTAGIADPEMFNNLRNQWSSFIEQPGNRAFLLQTGLALMQPPSFGDNPASQIGRAVGEGAEAQTRQQIINSKLAESESKSEANVARAHAAGSSAEAIQSRLGLDYFKRQSIERGQEANQLIAAQKLYESEKKNDKADYARAQKLWTERNALLPKSKQEPPLSPLKTYDTFEEWARDRAPHLLRLPGIGKAIAPAAKPRPQTEDDEDN